MDITPGLKAGAQAILGYGPGYFRIGHDVHEGPVLVLPERVIPWTPRSYEEIGREAFQPLIDVEEPVEVVILGVGARMTAPLSRALKDDLRAAGITVEPMLTDAACRTFNILLTEDRRAAAALLPL